MRLSTQRGLLIFLTGLLLLLSSCNRPAECTDKGASQTCQELYGGYAKQYCNGRSCTNDPPECSSASDCMKLYNDELVCDGYSCVECVSNSDCGIDEECYSGECVEDECSSDSDCSSLYCSDDEQAVCTFGECDCE